MKPPQAPGIDRLMAIAVLGLVACRAPAAEHASSPSSSPSRSRVEYAHHRSETLGVDKKYLVYVPAGYDAAPARRWPVFYYLHGLTSPETEWIQYGKLDVAADALQLQAIVVMPDADDGFYIDSAAPIDYDACLRDGAGLYYPDADRPSTCVHRRAYETYITDELVAHIDARYRTIASRDGRAIAGVSMGGYGALSLALRHPELYAAAASHSGVATLLYEGPTPYVAGQGRLATEPTRAAPSLRWWPWVQLLFGADLASWRAHDPAVLLETLPAGAPALYLDCGTEDRLVDLTRFVDELLTRRHIDHVVFYGPGQHDYDFWVARVPASLAFLRDHTSAPR